MPLYEYKCKKCNRIFEYIQKFTDKPKEVCENCGGSLGKIISQSAIKFKGSGWYVTDYAKRKKREGAEAAPDKTADVSGGGSNETPKTSGSEA